MKTTKAGVWPPVEIKPRPPVWVWQAVECTSCGWEGILEEGDNVAITSQARSPGGPVNIRFTCPTPGCARTIEKQIRLQLGEMIREELNRG